MAKAIFGVVLRHLLTLLIGLFVAKHIIASDVAAKLNSGDTVTLWGNYSISLDQIVNYLLLTAIPTLLPIAIGLWSRIKLMYKTIIARIEPAKLTASELHETVAASSVASIIATVAAPPK